MLVFETPSPQFECLNRLDRHHRFNRPPWGVDPFEEIGADEVERRAEEAAKKRRKSA